jgi:CBS-domain-containing membrane protein
MRALLAAHGVLLPGSVLHAHWFGVLAAFVAVNTVIYVALAVAKTMPKLYPRDWLPRGYQRAETRSIHPDDPA